jgi:antitoxin (DNA-binding transcriptional repressor) of toxin-antitoxin stability system
MSKQVSASDAKHNFGRLLEDVADLGRVDIMKHGRLVAVMLAPHALKLPTSAKKRKMAPQAKWGENHMIPADRARAARMVRPPRGFDED